MILPDQNIVLVHRNVLLISVAETSRFSSCHLSGCDVRSVVVSRRRADIGERPPICHPTTILRSLATQIRPNPPKDGAESRSDEGLPMKIKRMTKWSIERDPC